MRVVVLTRQNTDYARTVETFVNDFTRQTGKALEVIEADSKEAESLSDTYDIVEYPTIIAISDDGQLQNAWSGQTLPTISEVSYYVQ